MGNFVVGVVFGIAVATVGVKPLAEFLDRGIEQTKTVVKEITK